MVNFDDDIVNMRAFNAKFLKNGKFYEALYVHFSVIVLTELHKSFAHTKLERKC